MARKVHKAEKYIAEFFLDFGRCFSVGVLFRELLACFNKLCFFFVDFFPKTFQVALIPIKAFFRRFFAELVRLHEWRKTF